MTSLPPDPSSNAENPIINRVLGCQSLPSLPGVALRVLELTQDKNVAAQEIASTIQSDPALTTKVLRTVNSSYYALSTPCPSIKRATSLLGINTVKSIVLGFSLVESTRQSKLDASFDMLAYWRRAIYGAAAARELASHTRRCDPEEAFVGALLQDIGVLAFSATLKAEYDKAISPVGPDHELHSGAELRALGVTHAHIGSLLGAKWRLPPQIIECVKRHHEPEQAAPQYEGLVRCVSLAAVAAHVLSDTNDKRRLGKYITQMRELLALEGPQSRDLLAKINESGQQLSKSLELATGEAADISEIMAMANERLIYAQVEMQLEADELRRSNADLSLKSKTDALTGAFNRAHFDVQLKSAFDTASRDKVPLTVLFSDADKFKSVNDTHGHQAGDAVLIELARRLREALTNVGTVCRFGGEEFAILVPGADAARAGKLAELLRRKVCASPFEIANDTGSPLSLPVTISIGVATHDPKAAPMVSAEALVHAADQGVYIAKRDGRNCVRVGGVELPAASNAATPPAVTRILAIEDDAMAARLLVFLFERRRDLALTVVTTGEEALARISDAGAAAPQLVLCDINLPGVSGIEVVMTAIAHPRGVGVRFAMLSASSDPAVVKESLAAGAAHFIEKSDFCTNFEAWLAKLLDAPAVLKAAA
jgi:diguanylate cyclase (GGDEF)-like protein